jgi:hypothetical protein
MDVLRKAGAYKFKMYGAPDGLVEPIPAHGQVETQIRMIPGTYIWGLSFDASLSTFSDQGLPGNKISIQITEEATEIPLFADYIQAILMMPEAFVIVQLGLVGYGRNPILLPGPRWVGPPGQLNVEMYNDNQTSVEMQLVLYCAEPIHPNTDILEANRTPAYGRRS